MSQHVGTESNNASSDTDADMPEMKPVTGTSSGAAFAESPSPTLPLSQSTRNPFCGHESLSPSAAMTAATDLLQPPGGGPVFAGDVKLRKMAAIEYLRSVVTQEGTHVAPAARHLLSLLKNTDRAIVNAVLEILASLRPFPAQLAADAARALMSKLTWPEAVVQSDVRAFCAELASADPVQVVGACLELLPRRPDAAFLGFNLLLDPLVEEVGSLTCDLLPTVLVVLSDDLLSPTRVAAARSVVCKLLRCEGDARVREALVIRDRDLARTAVRLKTSINVGALLHAQPTISTEVGSQEMYQPSSLLADSAVGCLIGGMVGDVLGAGVEGWSQSRIRKYADTHPSTTGKDGLRDFFPCVHMGQSTYVGPPKDSDTGLARYGMYTDDTNAALALASSLVDMAGLDGQHAARRYGEVFKMEPVRFCPDTAQSVMEAILAGADYRTTGAPPHFPFEGGSFANGGAMRASPLGIAFRSAPSQLLRRAAEEAVRSSHIHPEAVDAAAVQARAVAYALQCNVCGTPLTSDALLGVLEDFSAAPVLKRRISALRGHVAGGAGAGCLREILNDGNRRPGSNMGFQIAAVDLMPCVLWAVASHHDNPEEALVQAVALGGDTDTVACLVGSILGALHGVSWIPRRWWDNLENGSRGRSYAVNLGERLAQLDLCDILTWGGA
mmetsp:Transcript_43497/g.114758  ORF Transcript_43497/g.114758 Transcript_43497/m.114758 type:complete len:670 (-) Transcript_43497:250-2259(-)